MGSWFREQPERRLFVRRVCRGIARIFGADRAVYVPDAYLPASEAKSMAWANATVAQAEAWLAEHCGPPAASVDRIVMGDDAATAGTYYVDRWHDLPPDV